MTDDQLLQELKKRIKVGFGKKCKDFNFNCPNCQAWMAYDILNTYMTTFYGTGEQ